MVRRETAELLVKPQVQRLWLVRHGVTQWNIDKRFCGHSDVALSSLGGLQARWVAERLRTQQIGVVYSSDLLRAQQTAGVIMQRQKQPVQFRVSTAWREICFGDWEGLTYGQIAEQYQSQTAFFSDPIHNTPPNGEHFSALLQRVQQGFAILAQDALNDQSGGDMLLVSHGGALRVLLCFLLGMPFEYQWKLRIDHGSLSAINFLADDPLATATLSTFNLQCPVRSKALKNARRKPQEGPAAHV